MDMHNPSNIKQNLEKLLEKMIDLNRSRDQVIKRKELHRREMDGWLKRIEKKENEVKDVERKINERRGDRIQLNKKVIQYLNDVISLISLGDANPETIREFLNDLAIGQLKAFSRAELQRYTSHFSKSNKIDSYDQFGNVYKGQFRGGGELITVKVLNVDIVEDIFISEVKILSNASHRNLVKLYGYCFEHDMKAVVYEYMEKGSFDKLLYGNPGKKEWVHFFNAAIETARGLAYLHEGCDTPIIHYDVKASNVFFDSGFCPKIADFGISKLLGKDKRHYTLTNTKGTPGYAAPEMWREGSHITTKCDVYSFGMMLFEVLRMEKNRVEGQDWFPPQVWDKFKKEQLDDLINECGIKEKNNNEARVLCKVALWCSQLLPDKRPSMSDVVKMLEMKIPVKDPTDPMLKFTAQVESQ